MKSIFSFLGHKMIKFYQDTVINWYIPLWGEQNG